MTALLSVEAVTKRFRGLVAVDEASFAIEPGDIFAVIGPNGAGKTTLFNMIAGVFAPDDGRILFAGERIDGRRPDEIAQRGIGRTFQIVRPFPALTVEDNVIVGALLRADGVDAARQHAYELLRRLDLYDRRARPAASLTLPDRKRLEVARALATGAELLLLDEVLAGLNPREVATIVPMLRALVERGVTILMIEHVMQAVMSLAERVFVLAEGRIIAEGPPQAVAGNPRVIESYLGRGAGATLASAGDAHA